MQYPSDRSAGARRGGQALVGVPSPYVGMEARAGQVATQGGYPGYGDYGDPEFPEANAAWQQQPPRQDAREDERAVRRRGLVGWWLDLTAPRWPRGPISFAERQRLRKAELTSLSILAVAGFLIALISNSLADPSTGQAVGTMAVGLLIAAVLNRTGRTKAWRTSVAAYLVPGLMMALLIGAILQAAGGLRLIWLPAYDLLALPIFIVSLTGHRRSPWIFCLFAIAFIVADFALQPHALITAAGADHFDDIAYETTIFGQWGMVNRHIALCFFAALVGWLGARSVEGAIRRADRAEELAALEHQLADQKRQLDVGIQQLLQTHVRAANGDFTARAPLRQENVLWQIASSLNNLLSRMQRTAQAEHQLVRTEEELRRLAAAIDDAQAGRPPLWPAATGTAADLILERIARGQRRRPAPGTPSEQGQMAGFGYTPGSQGWPSLSSQPMSHAPFGPGQPSSQPFGPSGYGQMPSSQPLGQPPYSADRWQPPAAPYPGPQGPMGQMEAPPSSPWILPQDPSEQSQ
jgi:hypothetical protein